MSDQAETTGRRQQPDAPIVAVENVIPTFVLLALACDAAIFVDEAVCLVGPDAERRDLRPCRRYALMIHETQAFRVPLCQLLEEPAVVVDVLWPHVA